MDDFEFYLNYIHENEIPKDEVNLDEDDAKHYQARNVRVNKGEKKIRGRDLAWVKRISFENSKAFEDSIVMEELKENYTAKRKRVYAYAIVHNYVCKYSQRGQYLPCRKEIRIIFPSESQNVLVQEAGEHEHIENPDFIGSLSFQWSRLATEIIVMGIQNRDTPKAMLKYMRDGNCFSGKEEPSLIQLYNKISHLKKLLNLKINPSKKQLKFRNRLEGQDDKARRKRGRPSFTEPPVVMIVM